MAPWARTRHSVQRERVDLHFRWKPGMEEASRGSGGRRWKHAVTAKRNGQAADTLESARPGWVRVAGGTLLVRGTVRIVDGLGDDGPLSSGMNLATEPYELIIQP